MGSFWSSQWVPRTGGKAEVRGTLPSLLTSIGASSLQNDTFPAHLTHAEGEKHFPSKVIRERWKLRRKRATRVGKHFIVNRWVRLSSWSVSQAVINMPCNSCNETANRLQRLTQGDAVDHLKMRKPVSTDHHTYFPSEGNQDEHQYHSWGARSLLYSCFSPRFRWLGVEGLWGAWSRCACVADGKASCFRKLWMGHLRFQVNTLDSCQDTFTRSWGDFPTLLLISEMRMMPTNYPGMLCRLWELMENSKIQWCPQGALLPPGMSFRST